jgi:hypothetical protein
MTQDGNAEHNIENEVADKFIKYSIVAWLATAVSVAFIGDFIIVDYRKMGGFWIRLAFGLLTPPILVVLIVAFVEAFDRVVKI